MIFKQERFVDEKGRVVDRQTPLAPDDKLPVGYVGTGIINMGPGGSVTLNYRIEAASIEDAFAKTDEAFQAAAKEWQLEQLKQAKRIVQPGDLEGGKVLNMPLRGGLGGNDRGR